MNLSKPDKHKMKITQADKFQPVTIVLENESEFMALYTLVMACPSEPFEGKAKALRDPDLMSAVMLLREKLQPIKVEIYEEGY